MQSHPHWERLAAAVRAARGPRTQKAVADAGGPSDTTIGKIESNEWRPKRGVNETLNKLDVGLGWEPGSAMRVLAGGDPIPNNNASGLGRGLASLIPTKSGATSDDEPNVDIAYPPPRPRTSREEWARKGQQLAQAVPMASYDDALKRRREAAEKALKKTFPGSTEPPAEMLRMMRELLEERELETLAERIEKLSRPLQLDVSSYVDDLLTLYGERQGPADDIDPLADLDPDFWPAAARKEDDPKEDDGVE